MGVHGLSTFLRENRRVIAKTIEFSSTFDAKIPLIVDGWSFIYNVSQNATLPWVYGGEYGDFSRLVIQVVEAWLTVGLKPYFVFDGPYAPMKFATALLRRNRSQVQASLLFFRTSPVSRETPRFLRESRIIPPLIYHACLDTLHSFLKAHPGVLELYYADDEGDPYAVELAARVGGFVTGQDSDFVVLNCEGYRGYIPLDEMVWATSSVEDKARNNDSDGEFQTARSAKNRKKSNVQVNVGSQLLPPGFDALRSGLTLSVSVYTPTDLATHLKLPVTLLPLVGALVGNDFTLQPQSPSVTIQGPFHHLLFNGRLTPSQRITHAATTLNTVLTPTAAPNRRRQKSPQSVMELIAMTISALLGPTTVVASGAQAKMVECIVDATLPYAIPPPPTSDTGGTISLWPSEICALHEPAFCPIFVSLSNPPAPASRNEEDPDRLNERKEITLLYIRAYRRGALSPSVMDILTTRTYWPELFLENPDVESVSRSIGRTIRIFGYSLLDDGTGLLESEVVETAEETPENNWEDEEEDPDELIDVIEEDSDVECNGTFKDVAKLRGALLELQLGDGTGEDDADAGIAKEPPLSGSISSSSRPIQATRRVVAEYIRKGMRVVAEEVEIPPLYTFLAEMEPLDATNKITIPVQLRPASTRFSIFLRFLQSDTSAISALSPSNLLPVLSLRVVVRTMHVRAAESGSSRDRDRERWTRKEARALLASFTSSPAEAQDNGKDADLHSNLLVLPTELPIAERSIQLTAQIAMAIESVAHLAQILLLSNYVPHCACRFSGRRFHTLIHESELDTMAKPKNAAVTVDEHHSEKLDDLCRIASDGLDACFLPENLAGKKSKKARKRERSENLGTNTDSHDGGTREANSTSGKGSRGSTRFGVLSDMDSEF